MSNYFGNLAANLTDKENTESNLITPLNNRPILSLKPRKLQ